MAIHEPTNHIVGDNREDDHGKQSHGNDITEDLGEEVGRHSIKTAHIFMPVERENFLGTLVQQDVCKNSPNILYFLLSLCDLHANSIFIPVNIYIV